ncbi:MAG: thermonuclease family protein [Bacilli bacterium]|nr:thermonuclease family protein [Bacilli bacterium]
MIKKILILFLIGFSFILCGCHKDQIKLPNLTGKTQSECQEILDELGIKYEFEIKKNQYYSEADYDRFYEYGNGLMYGDYIHKDTYLYVYTTPLHLTGNYIDLVKIDFEYQGKDFTDDGVGLVTLANTIDGDTGHFYDLSGDYVKVRFLGIDTPESTKEHEPWGKAASNFTSNLLKNAKEIVLYQENQKTDAYGRYLAYVWVDGILVNLYVIQEGYSNSTLGSGSKYFEIFTIASIEVSKTGRRFWGELDPNYKY